MEQLGPGYILALDLVPRTPDWIAALGLRPMSLGLDLQGGVHFLFEVNTDVVVAKRVEGYADDFSRRLREEGIRRTVQPLEGGVRVELRRREDLEQAEELVTEIEPDLTYDSGFDGEGAWITATLGEARLRELRNNAVSKNITILRNRVNELGVAEPLVQRQGAWAVSSCNCRECRTRRRPREFSAPPPPWSFGSPAMKRTPWKPIASDGRR